jgi:hypothetical protein
MSVPPSASVVSSPPVTASRSFSSTTSSSSPCLPLHPVQQDISRVFNAMTGGGRTLNRLNQHDQASLQAMNVRYLQLIAQRHSSASSNQVPGPLFGSKI